MVSVTFCGRTFTAQEVELMRVVAHDYAGLGVTEIARARKSSPRRARNRRALARSAPFWRAGGATGGSGGNTIEREIWSRNP